MLARLNATQPALYNKVKSYLESKTLKQIRSGTFSTEFKNELRKMSDDILGPETVKEIIVSKFYSK